MQAAGRAGAGDDEGQIARRLGQTGLVKDNPGGRTERCQQGDRREQEVERHKQTLRYSEGLIERLCGRVPWPGCGEAGRGAPEATMRCDRCWKQRRFGGPGAGCGGRWTPEPPSRSLPLPDQEEPPCRKTGGKLQKRVSGPTSILRT
jgi:hypothetical protein